MLDYRIGVLAIKVQRPATIINPQRCHEINTHHNIYLEKKYNARS
jgi:hypothetical protein